MRPARMPFPYPVLVLLILLAAPLSARSADCGPDCIGLYFDEAGTEVCHPGSPVTPITAYLILSGPTMDAIEFISFAFVLDGPVVVTGVNFGNPVICDPGEAYAYCTAWTPPLATTGPTILGVVSLLYTGFGVPAFLGIRNAGGVPDDRPWVVLPDDTAVPLNPAAGPGAPFAQIGGDCVIVPADAAAWGGLKSLYR